tara:strand:+ start:2164 stop:2571 length:408 start_codon:yes stop_codon:yes gene_type:complete
MKNSIKPKIWGPHGWKFLHYVSLGYPNKPTDKDKIYYKNFYYSLQNVLPCEKCAQNYKKNIIEYPIDNHLQNRDSLVKWVIDIHNKVNYELGKPQLDYEEAISLYLNEESKMLDYCFKAVILIIILIFLYKLLKK